MDIKSKLSDEQIAKLRAPLPPDAVTVNPAKEFLVNFKAWAITQRLTDVFGMGNWLLVLDSKERSGDNIVVKVTLSVPSQEIDGLWAFGGNIIKADEGDAYKGAVTDALTKIALQYFEIGLCHIIDKDHGSKPYKDAPYVDKTTGEERSSVKPTSKPANLTTFDPATEIMNFGKKHSGKKWIDVPEKYLLWMSEEAKEPEIKAKAFKTMELIYHHIAEEERSKQAAEETDPLPF